MGQLTLSRGPTRVEVRFLAQKATIPNNRVSFYIYKHHTGNKYIVLSCYVACLKIYSLFCRLKINHMTENGNMHLFLAQSVVRSQTAMTERL